MQTFKRREGSRPSWGRSVLAALCNQRKVKVNCVKCQAFSAAVITRGYRVGQVPPIHSPRAVHHASQAFVDFYLKCLYTKPWLDISLVFHPRLTVYYIGRIHAKQAAEEVLLN